MSSWNPDLPAEYKKRITQMQRVGNNADLIRGAKIYYKDKPIEFINDWCVTFDPRSEGKIIPFILFPRQREFIEFLDGCVRDKQAGLVEKCRDVGASYLSCAYSVWLWLFHPNSAIGWGSRKEALVDKHGDMSAIFPKMRQIIEYLPPFLKPEGWNPDKHAAYMKIINPENGSMIVGESGTSIGRGGRSTVFFIDEAAHLEQPEVISAALSANTDVQIDISSVNGTNNVFYRKRRAGEEWEPGKVIPSGKTRVFIFDWRDNPMKSQEWYDEKRKKWEDDGLLHVFAQEVDRDYSAAVERVLIPAIWVKAAIDAHVKLGIKEDGERMAGLDVADEGGDKNALVIRYGVVLKYAEDWGEGDTGATARRAISKCQEMGVPTVNYDCLGVGAGVKAETNRLLGEGNLRLNVEAWNAGAAPFSPESRLIAGDSNSPRNEDFFSNLKAQGWWNLRMRFEKTYKAVTQGVEYPHDDLISIDGSVPNMHRLTDELSQATYNHNGKGKIVVDKKPDGGKSPNLADAVVICFNPKIRRGFFS